MVTPIMRTIVVWGLNWGPPILSNYEVNTRMEAGACKDKQGLEVLPMSPVNETMEKKLQLTSSGLWPFGVQDFSV